MKKFNLLIAFLCFCIYTMAQTQGIGIFSISETEKVTFSPGNLQFNAALGSHQCADGTTQPGTWRFAEHQWDYVGDATNGTVYIVNGNDSVKCNNALISEDYDGWIDLFGWGTSGWNSGAVAYQPWATSTSYSDYYPGGNENHNLVSNYAYADWGIYNQISNDILGTWRTLTADEWIYLFHERDNAEKLFALGRVNGINGTIILPDKWKTPSGLNFHASTNNYLFWNGSEYTFRGTGAGNSFYDNFYTINQWKIMENHGAVFFPAAGRRNSKNIANIDSYGYIWSTKQYSTYNAYCICFYSGGLHPQNGNSRAFGQSIRLVKQPIITNLENDTTYTISWPAIPNTSEYHILILDSAKVETIGKFWIDSLGENITPATPNTEVTIMRKPKDGSQDLFKLKLKVGNGSNGGTPTPAQAAEMPNGQRKLLTNGETYNCNISGTDAEGKTTIDINSDFIVQSQETPDGLINVPHTTHPTTHKEMRDGQILIITPNAKYDLNGRKTE